MFLSICIFSCVREFQAAQKYEIFVHEFKYAQIMIHHEIQYTQGSHLLMIIDGVWLQQLIWIRMISSRIWTQDL